MLITLAKQLLRMKKYLLIFFVLLGSLSQIKAQDGQGGEKIQSLKLHSLRKNYNLLQMKRKSSGLFITNMIMKYEVLK